jgi:hypothetical protein
MLYAFLLPTFWDGGSSERTGELAQAMVAADGASL